MKNLKSQVLPTALTLVKAMAMIATAACLIRFGVFVYNLFP